MNVRKLLSNMRLHTFDYFPYLAGFVYSLVLHERQGLGTMCVDQHGNMYYDPEFVKECTVEQGAYAVLHETLHVVFKHHERGRAFHSGSPDEMLLFVLNVAADLVIEQVLTPIVGHRPAGAIHLGCYVEKLGMALDFDRGLSMEEYVRLILDRLKQGDSGEDGGEEQGEQPSSSAGNPGSQPGDSDGREQAGDPNSIMRGSCADGVPRDYEVQPDGNWESFGNEQAMQQAYAKIEQMEKDKPGSVPGALKETLRVQIHGVSDPWRELRTVVASSVAAPIGRPEPTYRRLNRRQPRNMMRLRGWQSTTPRAVVILDTSGSMCNEDDKAAALSCIADGLRKLSKFRVISADTRIQNRKEIKDLRQIEWHGGGGTNLDHVIEQVDRDERPDAIILISDCVFSAWPRRTRARLVVACTTKYRDYYDRVPAWARKVLLTSN